MLAELSSTVSQASVWRLNSDNDMMADTETRQWRIAKTLKEARAKSVPRVSQAEIARKLVKSGLTHITERHISRFELGYMEATTAEAKSIAGILSVSTDWLCGSEHLLNAVPVVPAAGLARASGTNVAKPVSVSESKWPACPGPLAVERKNETDLDYRNRLIELRATTNKMLHTSGLPASEWRQWRDLERSIVEQFRG